MEKEQKMTLKGYYDGLPQSSFPKTEFIKAVAEKTGVCTATVRNWIAYGMKPYNVEHINILSEMTGIPKEELWA